ncbi:hypothetical protein [Dapis sp. BLCC M229]
MNFTYQLQIIKIFNLTNRDFQQIIFLA